MIRRVAFPFLTLPEEAVGFEGWFIGDPGTPLVPASDILENWDYERDLEVSAAVELDMSLASEALELPSEEMRLAVGLGTGTGSGTKPRRVQRLLTKTADAQTTSLTLSAVVPGNTLSGRLVLELGVTLGEAVSSGGVLAPRHRGSRLWETRKDILIEDGGDSRFPMELVSFSSVFRGRPEQHAPWYVFWNPEALRADFGGNVRLYVNSDMATVAERFVEGDPTTIQAILGDVISQTVSVTLDKEDCDEQLGECEEGSLGYQISSWMALAFPGQDVGAIRSMRDHMPGSFRAALLAAADPGEEK